MSHALCISTCNVTPHLETSLEIAIDLLEHGIDVDYTFIGDRLPRNIYLDKFIKYSVLRHLPFCKNTRISSSVRRGVSLVKKHSEGCNASFRYLEPEEYGHREFTMWKDIKTIDDISQLTFRESNQLGMSIAGSLYAIYGNEFTIEECLPLIGSLHDCFMVSYQSVDRIIGSVDYKYSQGIVFNGRFPWIAGAVQRLNEENISVRYHERGANKDRYVCNSYMPHDREAFQEECLSVWIDDARRKEMGHSFFRKQRCGASQNWNSFVKNQSNGRVQEVLAAASTATRKKTKVVSYFSSSENEYLAIRNYWNQEDLSKFSWKSQKEAVRVVAKVCDELGYQLVVRVHPNLVNKSDKQRQQWDSHLFDGIWFKSAIKPICIASDSDISSYELIDFSDMVITFGSTIGAEAVYWGKRSLLLGLSFFDKTGIDTITCQDYEDVYFHLSQFSSSSVDTESAIPFGFYMSCFGTSFKYYEALSLFSGKLFGIDLQNRGLKKVIKDLSSRFRK